MRRQRRGDGRSEKETVHGKAGLLRAGGQRGNGGGTLALLGLCSRWPPRRPAFAQVDTGTILGTVKDQSGGVLPGATVTITHEGQAFTLTSVTREDGTYIFTPIRTGAYSVEVEFPGFKKSVRRGIQRRHPAAGGGRLHAADRRRRRGGRRHRRRAAAPDRHRHGRRDARLDRPSKTCRSTAATTPSSRASPPASCRRSRARARR